MTNKSTNAQLRRGVFSDNKCVLFEKLASGKTMYSSDGEGEGEKEANFCWPGLYAKPCLHPKIVIG